LADGPSLRFSYLGYTTVHVHNRPYTYSGLNINYKIEFSVSGIVQKRTFCQFGHILDQVWSLFVCMRSCALAQKWP